MISHLSLETLCSRVREQNLSVSTHSGSVVPGGVFVVMPAPVSERLLASTPGGERFLSTALTAAPGYIVCEPAQSALLESLVPEHTQIAAILVPSAREALGRLAQAAYGTDVHCPRLVGITGTNGKTTETYLLEALFTALGKKTGVLGTVAYRWPGHNEAAPLTTPDCLKLHAMLAQMAQAGVDTAFMEVSSHAIDQQRIAGLAFSAALMTNLTQDHLDYHADMEEYFQTKARLFRAPAQGGFPYADKARVLNADDLFCRKILSAEPGAYSFGLEREPVAGNRHLSGTLVSESPSGMVLSMEFEGTSWTLSSPLVGRFNAMNLLGAQALGIALGIPVKELHALEGFSGVSGRMERIVNTRGVHAFVDYAHTPDALVKALSALHEAGFSRIVTVFGCGGNRDRAKRPLMGEAVAALSSVAVLTSDNPRNEDPEAIIADVLPGLAKCPEVVVEPDRRKALAVALENLGPEDALLVAGKGHETYQQIGDVKFPFSDQEILRELLA